LQHCSQTERTKRLVAAGELGDMLFPSHAIIKIMMFLQSTIV